MDINSAVKRNNPVWNKNTVQETMTIPNPSGFIDLDPKGTYVMITNPAGANITLFNVGDVTSGLATTGINLVAGSTFECAIDLTPNGSANIRVVGTPTQTFTVTYFS
jgi:hypothetical protein